jgi:hypothetical protein
MKPFFIYMAASLVFVWFSTHKSTRQLIDYLIKRSAYNADDVTSGPVSGGDGDSKSAADDGVEARAYVTSPYDNPTLVKLIKTDVLCQQSVHAHWVFLETWQPVDDLLHKHQSIIHSTDQ